MEDCCFKPFRLIELFARQRLARFDFTNTSPLDGKFLLRSIFGGIQMFQIFSHGRIRVRVTGINVP